MVEPSNVVLMTKSYIDHNIWGVLYIRNLNLSTDAESITIAVKRKKILLGDLYIGKVLF